MPDKKYMLKLLFFLTLLGCGDSFNLNQFPNEVLLGQADYVSNSINRGGGADLDTLQRPYGLDSNGSRVVVADTNNHRVLVWNQLPKNLGESADFVLGQATGNDISANRGGVVGQNTLSFPRDVKIYANKLIVADAGNCRVLIWSSFPTSSADLPDVVIGEAAFNTSSCATAINELNAPISVEVDSNGRLFIADAGNHRVLVYNSIPTGTNANADFVLGQAGMNDGCVNNCGVLATDANTFSAIKGIRILTGDRLAVADYSNHRVLIWNEPPAGNNETADLVLGQLTMNGNLANQGAIGAGTFSGPIDIASSGSDLWITDFSNNRVLYWSVFPINNGQVATHVFGQNDFTSNTANRGLPVAEDSIQNPLGITLFGRNVLISDAMNHRVKLLIQP